MKKFEEVRKKGSEPVEEGVRGSPLGQSKVVEGTIKVVVVT